MKKHTWNALICALLLSVSAGAISAEAEIDIPFEKFTLDNGLTLIVHEDKKAPIVAVNVWYHVGSKDEKIGRTGFAHLFEHLMFNGSENYNDDWFKPFDRVGATGMNGTTNQDRTNYYQVVPKNALEMTLWMESDRMGHLLGAIDQAKLDEQRDVVKNEKRQRENQPYGRAFGTIFENVYPQGHPYSWSVIGSMEDLEAATVDDVHEWFKTKYGAANATITLAGDIDAQQAKSLVEKYFGHIDAGPPLVRQTNWVAKRTGTHEQVMYDRVPQARIYKVWNIPAWGTAAADYLDLASGVLSNDKKSRLYNRLVYNENKASDIQAFSFNSELGGLFGIVATALNEQDLDYIDQAIDEELTKFLTKGPTQEELARVKASARAGFVRTLERVANKADILAQHEVFSGTPATISSSNQRYLDATVQDVLQTSRDWIADGEYKLRILPYAKHQVSESTVDRSKGIPEVGAAPTVSFDTLQRATLSNGLQVILAERNDVPVVGMQLLIDAGYAADQSVKPGTANLAMAMLDEGTKKYDALEISSKLAQMGSAISSGASLDSSSVNLNSLKEYLEPTLDIFADMVLHPTFPQDQLDRLKKQQLASISQEKNSPFGAGLRLLPKLLYGDGHAYSAPFSGSGTEQSVASMTVSDLRTYHSTWFKANNATLIVTGDVSLTQLVPMLEARLSRLPAGEVPSKNIDKVEPLSESIVYLLDRPDSEQSAILSAKMLPKYGFDGELALELMNEVLGASFNSRINMNLREDKGWSYGARSFIRGTASERPFIAYAQVQTDKTAESMSEIYAEMKGIMTDKPAAAEELARSLDKRTLTLPGRWETAGAVQADIATMVSYGLEDDYWDSYVTQLREVNLEQVNQAAKEHLTPDAMLWVVVGDKRKIESAVRAANLGKVVIVNTEGSAIEE
ncbi:M16 family metallopeptidase [Arenicella xantha]|uniref:Zinc protease n=1 Tax=Arenicella xantha TaxID=644221 RepID=A0A395JRS8_9GAMM|nr:pitrilysin family protein [Arenicella xantha]RBP51400.1 zinc protease [Arenicella xantha]